MAGMGANRPESRIVTRVLAVVVTAVVVLLVVVLVYNTRYGVVRRNVGGRKMTRAQARALASEFEVRGIDRFILNRLPDSEFLPE